MTLPGAFTSMAPEDQPFFAAWDTPGKQINPIGLSNLGTIDSEEKSPYSSEATVRQYSFRHDSLKTAPDYFAPRIHGPSPAATPAPYPQQDHPVNHSTLRPPLLGNSSYHIHSDPVTPDKRFDIATPDLYLERRVSDPFHPPDEQHAGHTSSASSSLTRRFFRDPDFRTHYRSQSKESHSSVTSPGQDSNPHQLFPEFSRAIANRPDILPALNPIEKLPKSRYSSEWIKSPPMVSPEIQTNSRGSRESRTSGGKGNKAGGTKAKETIAARRGAHLSLRRPSPRAVQSVPDMAGHKGLLSPAVSQSLETAPSIAKSRSRHGRTSSSDYMGPATPRLRPQPSALQMVLLPDEIEKEDSPPKPACWPVQFSPSPIQSPIAREKNASDAYFAAPVPKRRSTILSVLQQGPPQQLRPAIEKQVVWKRSFFNFRRLLPRSESQNVPMAQHDTGADAIPLRGVPTVKLPSTGGTFGNTNARTTNRAMTMMKKTFYRKKHSPPLPRPSPMQRPSRVEYTKDDFFQPARKTNSPHEMGPRCRTRNKTRGFFFDYRDLEGLGGPVVDETNDTDWDVPLPSPELPPKLVKPSGSDWYRVRMDQIMQDTDQEEMENTGSPRGFLYDLPEHLPNSPLCPRHPKHPSGGQGNCPVHGLKKRTRAEYEGNHDKVEDVLGSRGGLLLPKW